MNQIALDDNPALFGDSVHPSTDKTIIWLDQKRQDKAIETTNARKRVNLKGALNLECMDFLYQDFETINIVRQLLSFLRNSTLISVKSTEYWIKQAILQVMKLKTI